MVLAAHLNGRLRPRPAILQGRSFDSGPLSTRRSKADRYMDGQAGAVPSDPLVILALNVGVSHLSGDGQHLGQFPNRPGWEVEVERRERVTREARIKSPWIPSYAEGR
ncbi:hypothetical protein PCH_Pc15g01680 [Penicillium rubens Wisconsin 54-1255]|uniref:Uncharacterized protein n=1 Tax=Penicillium rubens (strain ATCC 28089 / DSM 1075 / NRRL 1951 / Wisconsin 54-1255) TaxID=500485 RepID=B6H6A6_PENRW|nr:hypothetical protein PCH_Pc15g01680 [Penicillium rubens Wisconsin 54-1255]